jgi:hypothetical protein
MMPLNRPLLTLAKVHFVIGPLAGLLVIVGLPLPLRNPAAVLMPILATALCQAFLLALWASTSMALPWKRFAGLVVGASYLETLLKLALDDRTLSGLATLMIGVTTAAWIVVRAIGGRFAQQVPSERSTLPETHRLRFSIRGLMLLTAAAALFIAVARALRSIAYPEHPLLGNFFVSLCSVIVGLVALWGILDERRPLGRGSTVLVLSSMFAFLIGIAFNVDIYHLGRVLLVMLVYSAELLASLHLVRSSGYRFVRRTSQQPHRTAGDGNVGLTSLA